MSDFRTALSRARGLGAAKHGVGHWISERVSAAALIPLLLWGVFAALQLARLDHAGAVACAQRPFRLRVQRDKQHWILELRSARGSAPHRGQGTGTRYIEASLAASHPNRWHYSQGADGADWCSRIELTCAY